MPPKPRTPAPAQEVVFGISGDKWIWEEESPMFGGGGGALARLFRAEEFSKPGVLGRVCGRHTVGNRDRTGSAGVHHPRLHMA